jgi:acetyltransferase-like isoleucine patch superfamily enzyme
MIDFLMKTYRGLKRKLKFILSINWIKTYYFNLKMFPYSTAIKLPIYFFGKVRFSSLKGEIVINGPITRAMIGFGQSFEFPSTHLGVAELSLKGKLIFNGNAHIGKDFAIAINENGYCEFGYMATLGSKIKLICNKKILIGEWTGIGYESQIIDTNSHPMKNSFTGELYPMNGTVVIGSHNAISNRVSIMLNTNTPNYCVIASNSICNKNYSNLGSNILIGGIPAKLLKENFTRDWENEKELLKKYKKIT